MLVKQQVFFKISWNWSFENRKLCVHLMSQKGGMETNWKQRNHGNLSLWNPIQGPNMEFRLISRSPRFNSTNCWLCFVCFLLKDYDKVVLAIEIIHYLGMLRTIFARKATRWAAHPCFRFKAYVELATDAAQRWLPPEGELNQWGSFTSTAHSWLMMLSTFGVLW